MVAAGHPVEFGLLGPLLIRIDAKTVELGALKQRALLLQLLLRVGTTVSVDRLIDALWEHDPPPQARATLRSYVSSLRRILEAGDKSALLVTRGSGYGLQIDPDAVDAVRFERLVEAAGARLSAGEAHPALITIDEALGLWRGEALADVADHAFATGERTRLEELRLSAQEDRIDVLLALGRHGEAVASAEAFTAAEPLRERARGQLMLGLYRSGRAPDALAMFARFRESLIEELGLDPSRQLQNLAKRILNQAGDLELAASGVGTPTGAITSGAERVDHPRWKSVLEVRLLGPFELLRDDQVIPVRGASERALLALLATAPARVFTRDQLIDALWGESPPGNPQNALQLRVSKLRKAVGDVLATVPFGYRLDIGDDDVDALKFMTLVRRRRFDDALRLWRGEPLAEFTDHAWAAAEATRLRELHAVAVEEHVDERLAAGEHPTLIAELEGLTAADPLRERLRAQHMVALYRSGRTADALAIFQSFRRLLDEQLGIEPSINLRALEVRILRGDPSLDGPPATAPTAGNLPSLRSPLVGRDRQLDGLASLLESARLVTLTGPGGVGKTTLSIALGTRLRERFPAGTWFVPLAHVEDPGGVADAVARVLPVVDPDRGSAMQLVSAWLGPRPALLLLDNCEHLTDACAALVDELLDTADEDLRIIATSREPLGVTGEMQFPVPPLGPADASRLFVDRATRVLPDHRWDDDSPHVERICERVDGLPLAIELAAARAKTLSPEQIASRLDNRFQLLTVGPRTAESRHRTLRATVEWSHDLLNPRQQALFRRLAVFRGGWTLDAAETVCDLDETGRLLDVLGELVDRSMVDTADGRFRMLETIRAYAAEQLQRHGEHDELTHRHAEYFTAFAEGIEPRLRGPAQRTWLTRLREEDANLRVAMAWASDHCDRDPELGLRLGGALGWYWYVGRQTEGVTFLRATLDATSDGSDLARARALQALSVTVRPVGCIVHPSTEASRAAEEGATLFRAAGVPVGAAMCELLAAVEGAAQPDAVAALERIARARTELRSHGEAWGAALADFVEMEIRLHHGQVDAALALGRHAERAFDRLDDDWGRSAVMLHLGYGLRVVGRFDDAEEVLVRAVGLSRAGGLPNNLARAASELAEVALDRGEPDAAERWIEACELTARDLGNDTLLAMAHIDRAGAHRLHEDTNAAIDAYRRATVHARGSEFVKGMARSHLGLAATYLDIVEFEAAAEELDEAEREAARLADASVAATLLEQQARLAASRGDEERHDRLLREARQVRVRHGRPAGALDYRPAEVSSGSR